MKFVPKTTILKSVQKKRKLVLAYKKQLLKIKFFFFINLCILKFYIIKSKQLNYLITLFNKHKKKNNIKITLNFSSVLTKKPKGTRMGKGKGKFIFNSAPLYKGSKIFSFYNVRIGKVKYFKKKLEVYFGCKFKLNY